MLSADRIRAHKKVFRSVRDGGGADPHVRQFTCGGRVKIRGRFTRTGRHFGGSVLVPFRGWRPYLPLSGRQDVNRRAPLLFVAGYVVARMRNRQVAQIAAMLNAQQTVAKCDALSGRRDTKTTPRINVLPFFWLLRWSLIARQIKKAVGAQRREEAVAVGQGTSARAKHLSSD